MGKGATEALPKPRQVGVFRAFEPSNEVRRAFAAASGVVHPCVARFEIFVAAWAPGVAFATRLSTLH